MAIRKGEGVNVSKIVENLCAPLILAMYNHRFPPPPFYQIEHGTIIKALSTSSQSLRGCYLEEMKLLPANQQEPILNLQILQSDRSLFVGLSSKVLKIPLERCSSYETQR